MILPATPGERPDELVLTFGLKPGEHVDAVATAEAILAWVAAIQAANEAIDPGTSVVVDLLSAEEGSLRLRAILRFIENAVLGAPADALTEYPRLKKIVVATVLAIPAGIATGLAGWAILPDATVNIGDAEKAEVADGQRVVQMVPEVQKQVQRFYEATSRNRSVTEISVAEGLDSPPIILIPQTEFGQRAGVWEIQEQAEHERPRRAVWDVVVTHPALKSAPLVWKFERDGLPFSAKMIDKTFLNAVAAGTLPLNFREGAHMTVEVEWVEKLEGEMWSPVERSRKIKRVLEPLPRPAVAPSDPLFR